MNADTFQSSFAVPATMLVLVGEQRIPNAIPVRQFPGSIRKVEMIYSQRTEVVAQQLKTWFKSQGIRVPDRAGLMPIDNKSVNDFNVQRNAVAKILSDYSKDDIFANLTGGTKIMSLAAATEVARGGRAAAYVDTENKSFWWIHPTGRKLPLTANFNVEDFFVLHGQPWRPPADPSVAEQGVARTIGVQFDRIFFVALASTQIREGDSGCRKESRRIPIPRTMRVSTISHQIREWLLASFAKSLQRE